MHEHGPNEIPLPTEAIPTLKTIAASLTERLGCPLNYAQTYIVLSSARASGALDAIGCRDFIEQSTDPRLIETVAVLLEQNPELLDELQNNAKWQDFK